MITSEDQQWIDEHEIIEKYLLGRLAADEQERFSRLRKSHEELKAKIDLEAMLIAAIRQKGREAVKDNLRKAISAPKILTMSSGWRVLKIAAALAVVVGGSLAVYYALKPEAPITPVATKESLSPKEPQKEAVATPEDKPVIPQQDKEEKEALATRKSTEKPKSLVVVPHKPPLKKRETLTMPPPTVLTVEMTENAQTRKASILFQDPSAISGVQQTFGEKGGMLEWFYVSYEAGNLKVYLDASRFSPTFANARLKIDASTLWISIGNTQFRVNLDDPSKFHKATLE